MASTGTGASASTHSLPEKRPHPVAVAREQLDTAAALVAGADAPVDPAAAAAVRRKIDRYLMPLMCWLYMSVRRHLIGR
jgi:ACS family allantoate permease-like MFS transporter